MNTLFGNFRCFGSAETFEHGGGMGQGTGQVDVLGAVVLILPVLMILAGEYQKSITGLHDGGAVAELMQKLSTGNNEKLKVILVSVHI